LIFRQKNACKKKPSEDHFCLKAKRGHDSNAILGQTERHHFWPFQEQTSPKMLDLMLTQDDQGTV
jgi:hypothetical protein